jgi:hypothetical protein
LDGFPEPLVVAGVTFFGAREAITVAERGRPITDREARTPAADAEMKRR